MKGRRLRRRVRTLLASRGFESRLVWMFGSPRSGSTWLLYLMAEHQAVVPINEPLIGLYLSPFVSDASGFDTNSLDSRNFTYRQVQENKRHQFFAREFSDVVTPALGEMMRKRFLAQLVRYPPQVPLSQAVTIVKEPSGSQSADLISCALPSSRLLFLLRDGRDVIDSALAASLKGSWVTREFPGARGVRDVERHDFVVENARKWLWRTEVVQDAIRTHPGPTYMLKYEDMLGDPAGRLSELFAWLGLAAQDDEIASMVEKHAFDLMPSQRRGPTKFYRAATPGLWRENLTAAERASVTEIIGTKLHELGYEV